MRNLEAQFDIAMLEVYQRAKEEAGYRATAFFNMLNEQRGLLTAKQLINSGKVSQGYAELHKRGFLHLTVEAVVVENSRWHPLFTNEEVAKARARLKQYEYEPKS